MVREENASQITPETTSSLSMEAELAAFKNPELARGLIESIQKLAPEQATLMETCTPFPFGCSWL